ncbi:MAG: imidazole glycerol phosphate synthase, glutamine amidotransferase subunit [Deltaproteobacteria bacterium RBG_13_43_22]|nr:MAG: imidazole glycerol phosphate synthase, glutamine amidotransferase subunit [Deltaproteobacteria bacterium RBG_13_43_22]
MISIIDYKAGNLTSVERALKNLSIPCRITNDPELVLQSDRVIFPGVGAAGEAMKAIQTTGLDKAIKTYFFSGRPLLGICLGTQIILEFSQENQTSCLGILPGEVIRFPDPHRDEEGKHLKIPHMGWNRVEWTRDHPLVRAIPPESVFYFVHSYYPVPREENLILGRTHYGFYFPSAVAFRNLVALQFHPEKSGPPGLALLKAFSEWEGKDAD